MTGLTRSSIIRRAEALGWQYEAHLRGLEQSAQVAFVSIAEGFSLAATGTA